MGFKRVLLGLPFVVAALLTLAGAMVDRFHLSREHVAGYLFLFAAPWAWLVDNGWLGTVQNRWIDSAITYALLLWIPALLYSICLWLLIGGVTFLRSR